MKKTILMLAAVAAFSGLTFATSFTTADQTCTSAGGVNGATSFAATPMTCAGFAADFGALPVGDTLTAVNIYVSDSFNQGVPGTTDVFDFNWTLIDTDIKGTPSVGVNTCNTTTGAGALTSCQDTVSGQIAAGAFYQLGEVITTFTENYLGAGSFAVGDVSANIDPSAPGTALNATGSIGTTAFVTFTYSTPSTGTPEPGSMMLLGGGLLAAGLIGRKKFVSK